MGTEDKLYKKIQQAAENIPSDTFPGMEKVWTRVEEKLQNNTLKKEKNNWKKISIAASVIIVFTVLFNLNKKEPIQTIDKNTITLTDTLKKEELIQKEEVMAFFSDTVKKRKEDTLVAFQKKNILIKSLPLLSLQKDSISFPSEEVQLITNSNALGFIPATDSISTQTNHQFNSYTATLGNRKMEYSNFSANGIANENPIQTIKKTNPLVIIDGKVDSLHHLKTLDAENVDSIYVLTNPLYIINGVEYSEASLFGQNPTSPYYPLDNQKIISTTILYKEEGEKIYGKKGKEGVVIITTKNGKPNQK
ncbi:MAG: hypothetical protein CMP76_06375 [Flavobacterium sp.]|uniref:hypothetical protein n=1 Tax=Flavobacterium sp. TaxID=239 RepID=UPI000C5B868E|nr:hypothetical protein [Flavobacterium sp.]MBF02905.1 hypothetical protein [Flavobacterium sp.]|tara:strand:+ start:332 stop:1249 length:918 start_codon:yes stop_codon:yes gene_type:complete